MGLKVLSDPGIIVWYPEEHGMTVALGLSVERMVACSGCGMVTACSVKIRSDGEK